MSSEGLFCVETVVIVKIAFLSQKNVMVGYSYIKFQPSCFDPYLPYLELHVLKIGSNTCILSS